MELPMENHFLGFGGREPAWTFEAAIADIVSAGRRGEIPSLNLAIFEQQVNT